MAHRIRRCHAFIGSAALVTSLGCTSTPDELPDGGADITFTALDDGTDAALKVDSAEVSLLELTLVPCDAATAALTTRNLPIDLMRAPSAEAEFESSVTDYCGVRIALGPWPKSELEELEGLSVLLQGTRADDVPVEVRSTLATTLVFTSQTGPLDAKHLFLGVDLASWLGGVDFDAAETFDGTVLIDADHNEDALAELDSALPLGWALYVDTNHDRTLTDDELTPVATAESASD